jgi:hypothetical protein
MFRLLRACLLALSVFLVACDTVQPVWNEDGKSLADLRTLRIRGRSQVQLAKGLVLHADEVRFTDKSRRSGEAVGRVFLDVGQEAPYGLLAKFGYAGKASFDLRNHVVMLANRPILEWDHMTQVATAPYTTIQIHWTNLESDVKIDGPTRTDFARSYKVPAGLDICPPEKRS